MMRLILFGALAAGGMCLAVASPAAGGDTAITHVESQQWDAKAQIKFVKGYTSWLGAAAMQRLSISNAGDCSDLDRKADLLWTTRDVKPLEVHADRPLTLLVTTTYIISRGLYQNTVQHCELQADFIPISGSQYEISVLAAPGSDCTLTLKDEATGLPPPDLRVNDGAACLRTFVRAEADRKRARSVAP